jgi:hypothetical protein
MIQKELRPAQFRVYSDIRFSRRNAFSIFGDETCGQFFSVVVQNVIVSIRLDNLKIDFSIV